MKDKLILSVLTVFLFLYILTHLNNRKKNNNVESSVSEEVPKISSTFFKENKPLDLMPKENSVDKKTNMKIAHISNNDEGHIYSSQPENVLYSQFKEDDIFTKTRMNTTNKFVNVNFDMQKIKEKDENIRPMASQEFDNYDYGPIMEKQWLESS